MARTTWVWAAVFGVFGLLDLALTSHAHANWHSKPGGPSVLPIGQLLGFASSVVLLVAAVLLVVGGVRSVRNRRR